LRQTGIMAEASSQYVKTYLIKAIAKLETFNRIRVIFNYEPNKFQDIASILLRVKTALEIEQSINILLKRKHINITDSSIKETQKTLYKKQNRIMLDMPVTQGKSNLFGWNPVEDAPIIDKYISQPLIQRYIPDIISLDEYDKLTFIKENRTPITEYSNVCKDTILTESYLEYKLVLDSATTFYIAEYYLPDSAGASSYKKTNIVLECEFNEESRVNTQKLDLFAGRIRDINYLLGHLE